MDSRYETRVHLPYLKEMEKVHRRSRNIFLGVSAVDATLAGYFHDFSGVLSLGAATLITGGLAVHSYLQQRQAEQRIDAIENRVFNAALQRLEQSNQIV